MLRRVTVLGLAMLTAMVGFLSPAAPASAVPPQKEDCHNIGNGNLCIRVKPTSNLVGNVTVWYDKNAGAPRYVRLTYKDPAQRHWDDGPFWIDTGAPRGYIWYNKALSSGCYIGQMQDLTEGALGLITGGHVCY